MCPGLAPLVSHQRSLYVTLAHPSIAPGFSLMCIFRPGLVFLQVVPQLHLVSAIPSSNVVSTLLFIVVDWFKFVFHFVHPVEPLTPPPLSGGHGVLFSMAFCSCFGVPSRRMAREAASYHPSPVHSWQPSLQCHQSFLAVICCPYR